jgi:hypothetical protein
MPDGAPQAKGTTIIDLVKLARQNLAAFEAMVPAASRAILLQSILPSSWYPEETLRDLLVAADRLRGRGDLGSCMQLGRVSAQKDLQGVYRALLVRGNPEATLTGFPRIWSLYHDTGTVTVEHFGEREARVVLRDHGLPSRALCLVTLGWIAEAVTLAGGATPQTSEDACRCQGGSFCVYRVAWS